MLAANASCRQAAGPDAVAPGFPAGEDPEQDRTNRHPALKELSSNGAEHKGGRSPVSTTMVEDMSSGLVVGVVTVAYSGATAGLDTPTMAVVATMAAAISARISVDAIPAEALYDHVLAAVVSSTLFTGIVLFCLGYFRLGQWMRQNRHPAIRLGLVPLRWAIQVPLNELLGRAYGIRLAASANIGGGLYIGHGGGIELRNCSLGMHTLCQVDLRRFLEAS